MKSQILILALLAIGRTAGASAEHGDGNGIQYYAGDVSTPPVKSKKPRHLFYALTPVLGVGGQFEHSLGSGPSLSWQVGADMDVELGKYISVWGTFRTISTHVDYFETTPEATPVHVSEQAYGLGMGGAIHPFGGKGWPFDLALKGGLRFLVLDNDQFRTWAGGISVGGSIRIDVLRYLYLTADASWTYNAFHPGTDSDLGILNRLGGPRSLTTYSAGIGFRAGPHASLNLGFEGEVLELRETMRYYAAATMSFMLKF